MKKKSVLAFLTIAMLSVSSLSYAQFTKGQVMLDGNISFYNDNSKFVDSFTNFNSTAGSGKTSTFNFNPSIARFSSENTMYGIGLNYFTSTQTQASINGQNTTTQKLTEQEIGVSFYTRHYLPLGKNFYVFFEAGVSPYYFSSNSTSSDTSSSPLKETGFLIEASLTTGLAYKLTKRFLLDITLPSIVNVDYQHIKQTSISTNTNSSATDNQFLISSGLAGVALDDISIGMSLLLHK